MEDVGVMHGVMHPVCREHAHSQTTASTRTYSKCLLLVSRSHDSERLVTRGKSPERYNHRQLPNEVSTCASCQSTSSCE